LQFDRSNQAGYISIAAARATKYSTSPFNNYNKAGINKDKSIARGRIIRVYSHTEQPEQPEQPGEVLKSESGRLVISPVHGQI
jgi:hypothetical protein